MSALMEIAELRQRASQEAAGPSGGRPATVTLTLGPDWSTLPTAAELGGLLSRSPVAGVRFAEPVDFSALPAGALVRIVALLRECSTVGARVSWSLVLDAGEPGLAQRLDHLPAPESVTVAGKGEVDAAWRSTDTFGLLYFRRGPGFLAVGDFREGPAGQSVMEDPALRDVFLRALEGCPWADVTGDDRAAAAAAELVDLGLLLRVGDHCVTLPVHMRTWPLGSVLLGGTLAAAGKKVDDTQE